MSKIQIFRDPATNKPLWAVVHDAPHDLEARHGVHEPLSAIFESMDCEASSILVTTDEIPVEVL